MNNNKAKIYMIFSLAVLVIAIIVSGTYAYYVWTTSDSDTTKIVAGVGAATVTFNGGSDISANLKPVADKSEGIAKTISVKADTTGLVFNMYLDITSIDTNLKEESFRYELYKGTTKVKEGNFSDSYLTNNTIVCSKNNTSHIVLLTNESISTTETEYTLYIWVDGANYTNPSTMMNKTFKFKLHADGEGAVLNNSYQLTNNDGTTYTPTYTGSGTKAVRSTAPLSKFREVRVDDIVVDSSNYTLTEGSTIVTFKETYLKSLSAGNHLFKIVSTDGFASGILTIKKPETAATYITSLYTNASKTSVTNNSIDYNTAPSVSLMNDRKGSTSVGLDEGNIRYYSASPNNYIYFNCSDYSNQSSSTCETWRIIGVFDGKLKLIRGSQIGTYSWDNKNTSTGAEEDYGKNDWTTARLMKLLNPSDYYKVDPNDNNLGQSLYYNSASGKCYSDPDNATVDCDFTSIGIKNDTTRNMIAETTWNIGGYSSRDTDSNQAYGYERGTIVYEGRPTIWTGKIALAYPSDYGYAADFNQCKDKILFNYNDSTCTSNNWMKTIITNNGSNNSWLLTPNSNSSGNVWYVYSSGTVNGNKNMLYYVLGVAPVLYLNSDISIESGDGLSSNPYKLSV